MRLFVPIAASCRIFRIMLQSISSLFSERAALSILFLVVCLLVDSVTAIDQSMNQVRHDGSLSLHSVSTKSTTTITLVTYDIYLGEHHPEKGEHTLLLRFQAEPYHEDFDFCWPKTKSLTDHPFQWTYIGQARFENGLQASREAFERAQQYAEGKSRLYPNVNFYAQNPWRFPYNVLLSLHVSNSIDLYEMKSWQDKLPESMKKTLTKRQQIYLIACAKSRGATNSRSAENAYLRIDDLIISPYDEQQVEFEPSTRKLVVPQCQIPREYHVGEIRKDVTLLQIRILAESGKPKFYGCGSEAHQWQNSEAKWAEVDAQVKAAGKRPSEVKDFANSLRYWKSNDGFIHTLWAYDAIMVEELRNWNTKCSQLVSSLVRDIDQRMVQREQRLQSKPVKNPSTDVLPQ
ncbi:hypothetical protein F5880DRAFT_3859 [Lentinula raphanica]|nr:hypothetical protein F5880DRAFT_3859 [Lentinula raphanica]